MSEEQNRIIAGEDTDERQLILAEWYKAKKRPLCLCRNPGVEMYIAKVNDYYIVKRMPNSGGLHASDCDSYEPPPELSGLGEVLGSAIQENSEIGVTELKFGFSLTKVPGRGPQEKFSEDPDSVKTDGSKLTLRSVLHYMWDQAGFNRWTPAMSGKRKWHVVQKHLLLAAEDKQAKGSPLVERLYIPEPYFSEKKTAIAQRRIAQMSKVNSKGSNSRQLMLVIGDVKTIEPARYGFKIILKHAPDYPFMLHEDIYKRMQKLYKGELELWEAFTEETHLMAIATVSVSSVGIASVEELALMPANDNWIPFESAPERTLIEDLITANRRFTKGLRYNLQKSKPLASVVLSDTLPLPTAMYIIPDGSEESYIHAVDTLIEESSLESWKWHASEYEVPPMPSPGESK